MDKDATAADSGFEAVYVTEDGAEHRVSLAALAGVRLEAGRPVRTFPSYRGQRNYPGWYWSATMCRRVGFESWVERDHPIVTWTTRHRSRFAPIRDSFWSRCELVWASAIPFPEKSQFR